MGLQLHIALKNHHRLDLVTNSPHPEMLKPLIDEVYIDNLGNLIEVRHGSGELKIIVKAHMDEMGIVVRYVDDDGWIWFDGVGGIHESSLLGQRMTILHLKDLSAPPLSPVEVASLSDVENAARLVAATIEHLRRVEARS